MKRILIILTLLSCEKEDTIKCYTCNQRVMVNNKTTFRTFRDCGKSKEYLEQINSKPFNNGNELYTKCNEER
jgi:DNA-directed RNA polymerase subunit RPC12/RpoP